MAGEERAETGSESTGTDNPQKKYLNMMRVGLYYWVLHSWAEQSPPWVELWCSRGCVCVSPYRASTPGEYTLILLWFLVLHKLIWKQLSILREIVMDNL